MYYPRTVKTNMRHRGPVETVKLNRNNQDTVSDISSLYKEIMRLHDETEKYKGRVYTGNEEIAGLGVHAARLDRATLSIKNIERGVQFD